MRYEAYAIRTGINEYTGIGHEDRPLSASGKKLFEEATSQAIISHYMHHDGELPDRVEIRLELDAEHFLKPEGTDEANNR